MSLSVKLGKKPARVDHRIRRMSEALPNLPNPPLDTNWNASVSSWGMLDNDKYGDCVEAAVLHCIQQFSTYAGTPLVPNDLEATGFYEKATGFSPEDPSTDQGSYVMGPGGVMEYWTKTGVTCGGVLNKVRSFVQIIHKEPVEWMQGIYLFGGLLVGLQLPESVLEADAPVWNDFSGPVAGGHEVFVNGYETLNSGRYYNVISWGQEYRASEAFLLNCIDEVVVVIDDVEFNARGVDAGDRTLADLSKFMESFKV